MPDESRNYRSDATYYPYVNGTGTSKGILFRVKMAQKEKKNFTIDSFYVHAKPVPFITKNTSDGIWVEANYVKVTAEPLLGENGKVKDPKQDEDEIITQQKFYPSWILVSDGGRRVKIRIEKYQLQQEKTTK
jgi:hypothetical protein